MPHGRQPATWQVLSAYGLTLRGPHAQDLTVDTAPGELDRWGRENLARYWRPWRERSARLFTGEGLACLGAEAAAWGVLGVSRSHQVVATGRVTSKTAAGAYARDAFGPAWHRVLDEALRIRRGDGGRSLYPHASARRRDVLAFVGEAVDRAEASH